MTQLLPKPSEPAESPAPPAVNRSFNPRRLVPLVLLLIGGGVAAWYWLSRPQSDDLAFSGRIEGYETDIGTKVAGRVEEVTVREGETVQAGQPLVYLDDAELQAQLQGAIATLEAAKQQEANARLQISVLESQVTEAQLNLQQAQESTQGQVSQAEAQVASAIAQLREAEAQVIEVEAQVELARLNRDRYAQLVNEGAVTQQQFDQAQTEYTTAQATLSSRRASVEAAQRQVSAAQGNLTQSRSTGLNPGIREAQLARLNTQLQQARVQLAAAQSEVANAAAARQRIQAQLDDLNIASPIDGVVTVRSVEPGTVVTTGRTLLTLVDLDSVYLRGFIPEGQIGHVRVGQPARIYLDSNPDQPLTGRVSAIDAEASFTPENIYFEEDRVQQVFGVRIAIDDPDGYAKPGMPADGEIVLEE